MEPLFDKNCSLVAWIEDYKYIFDIHMNWIAFVVEDNVFASKNCEWLGPINDYNCLDKTGKVVAWNPDHEVKGSSVPYTPYTPYKPYAPHTPYTPCTPYTPYTPYTPLGGWSKLKWEDWIK